MTPANLNSIRERLEPARRQAGARLTALRGAIRRELALEGVAWALAVTALLAGALLAVDWWFRPELATRLSILPVALIVVFVVAWTRLVRPLTVRLGKLDLAALVDRRQPGLGQRLAAVLELPKLLSDEPQASPPLVEAAVLADAQAVSSVDLTSLLDRRRRHWHAAVLVAALVAPIALSLAAPGVARLFAARWLAGSRERWPQRNYLAVLGVDGEGRLTVPRGESIVVQVESKPAFDKSDDGWRIPGRGDQVVVRTPTEPKAAVPAQVRIEYTDDVAGAKTSSFTRAGDSRFRYELPPVVDPLSIEITGGDDWLEPVLVRPIDRPALESLVLLATSPGDPTAPPERFEGAENALLFLRGSALDLTLKSRIPLASAALLSKEGQPPALERVDDRTYRARWTMDVPLTLEIQMIGRDGELASKPAFLSIGLLKDREPRVTLRSSGVGRRVTPQVNIPLNLRAVDDFGIAGLALELERITPSETAPKTETNRVDLALAASDAAGQTPNLSTEDERDQPLLLAEYKLTPGALVKIRGAATDQCHEGSQTGVSRWLSFQVVSPEELFYEILMRQRQQRTKFAKSVEMAKAQTATLEGDATPEAVPGLVRAHQVVARQVWEVGNRLDATLVEMRLNQLGTPQALELLETKVIKPLRELHAGPLAQLRPQLDRLAAEPAQFADTLSAARPLQRESFETMQKILAQMSQWESFVDVMNQLDEITKLQQSVLQATEQKRKASTENVFDD